MSRIKAIRESVDSRLDKLDAHVEALEAALHHAENQIRGRIERGKQEVHQALDTLTADLDKSKQVSEEYKHKVRATIDDLKVQIALGKAEARDELSETRKRLHEGAQKMEAEVDAALAEAKGVTAELLEKSVRAYVRAMDTLGAELEAAETRYTSVRDKADAAFEKRRQETLQKISAFKKRLADRKQHTGEKLLRFEKEIRSGFEQVMKAFKDLFA